MPVFNFPDILMTYGNYWEKHDQNKETWGLFGFMGLNNKASGRFGISATFTNQDGTVKDLSVLNDFLD